MADTFVVERSATIDAPAATIYPHIADFHQWPSWSPWEDIDPELERTYSGSQAGAGARYAWKGNRKAGQGTMEMLLADSPGRVEIDLVFEKPWKAHNDTVFVLEPLPGDPQRTQVTWTMAGPQTLVTKVFGRLFNLEKMLGKDFDKGLARLRTVAESETGDAA